MRNSNKILLENLKGRDHLENIGVRGKAIPVTGHGGL
jgi:hypothetical protein